MSKAGAGTTATGGNAEGTGGDNSEGTTTAGNGETTTDDLESGKTFTSDEVEAIVKARVARVKAKYADHDQLRQQASQAEQARLAALSEQERAVEQARAEGRAEASKAAAKLLAAAEVKAALAGLVPEPAEIVEDLDLTRYVDATTGEVDAEAIASLKARYAKLAGRKTATASSTGHGNNGSSQKSGSPAEQFADIFNSLG